MSLAKQAKPLTKAQIEAVLGYLARTRHPVRNGLIFLLSIRAGLRAREIALLTWSMVTDAEGKIGHVIALQDEVSKGRSGRVIPIHSQLRAALIEWHKLQQPASSSCIIRTERSGTTSPQAIVNMFARWYEQIGFDGCSSHSGRRTFITNAARKISLVAVHSVMCRCSRGIRACALPNDTSTLTKTPNGRSSSSYDFSVGGVTS